MRRPQGWSIGVLRLAAGVGVPASPMLRSIAAAVLRPFRPQHVQVFLRPRLLVAGTLETVRE